MRVSLAEIRKVAGLEEADKFGLGYAAFEVLGDNQFASPVALGPMNGSELGQQAGATNTGLVSAGRGY